MLQSLQVAALWQGTEAQREQLFSLAKAAVAFVGSTGLPHSAPPAALTCCAMQYLKSMDPNSAYQAPGSMAPPRQQQMSSSVPATHALPGESIQDKCAATEA